MKYFETYFAQIKKLARLYGYNSIVSDQETYKFMRKNGLIELNGYKVLVPVRYQKVYEQVKNLTFEQLVKNFREIEL